MQLSLLEKNNPAAPTVSETPEGLLYFREFLTAQEEYDIIERIDENLWSEELSRRVQHYGYRYDYRQKNVDGTALGPLPRWLSELSQRINDSLGFEPFSQVIVNEYLPGQGIASHADSSQFGPVVATVSLASSVLMEFTHPVCGDSYRQCLERRSLLIMSGAARSEWQHGIAKRKSDNVDGRRVPRSRRLSMTFRTVGS